MCRNRDMLFRTTKNNRCRNRDMLFRTTCYFTYRSVIGILHVLTNILESTVLSARKESQTGGSRLTVVARFNVWCWGLGRWLQMTTNRWLSSARAQKQKICPICALHATVPQRPAALVLGIGLLIKARNFETNTFGTPACAYRPMSTVYQVWFADSKGDQWIRSRCQAAMSRSIEVLFRSHSIVLSMDVLYQVNSVVKLCSYHIFVQSSDTFKGAKVLDSICQDHCVPMVDSPSEFN